MNDRDLPHPVRNNNFVSWIELSIAKIAPQCTINPTIALFSTSTFYLFQKVLEILKNAHIISGYQIKKYISEFLRKK